MAHRRTSRLVSSVASCAIAAAGFAALSPTPASAAGVAAAPAVSQPGAAVEAAARPRFLASSARFGVTGSASVRNLQRLLIRKGHATAALRGAGATGSYYKATRASVRKFQRKLGYSGAAADGIIGKNSATRLGLRWVGAAVTSAPAAPISSQPWVALSATQLKSVLQRAGFREPSIRVAFGIAMRESGGQPGIVSPKNSDGTRDHGLFQINDVHRSYIDFTNIYDPVYNASVAYGMSAGGTDFSAWGIGDKGWAGQLKKQSPVYWQQLQDLMNYWKARYPG